MFDFILLNILVGIFLLLGWLESNLSPQFKLAQKVVIKFNPRKLLFLVIIGSGLTILLITKALPLIVYNYLFYSQFLLLIIHVIWVNISPSLQGKIIGLIGLIIFIFRLIYPSDLSHNLFIGFSLVWIGSFSTQIGLVNIKRFLILSLLWFIYDVVYVWLSPLSSEVTSATEKAGFALAFWVGNFSIGTGDLIWSNFLINLLKPKMKLIGILTLIISNLIFGFFLLKYENFSFPLLVLWVPTSLALMKINKTNFSKVL